MQAGISGLQDVKRTAGAPFSPLNIKEARGPAAPVVSPLAGESSPQGFPVAPQQLVRPQPLPFLNVSSITLHLSLSFESIPWGSGIFTHMFPNSSQTDWNWSSSECYTELPVT